VKNIYPLGDSNEPNDQLSGRSIRQAADPDFSTAGGRSVNRERLRQRLILRMQNSDGLELVELLSKKGVPCAPILDVPQALKHPHTAHRAMTVSMSGGYKGMASPIKLSRTPATYRLPPPADC
jgi:crotonobetainyl-CoA:carnitine CoA-transferase CaiB-like acyl-CoA transferase